MSTGDTIEAMTPLIKKTQYYWKCQRASCKHVWPAKDITQEPTRCAKCKRLDWNRETKALGRPRTKPKPGRPKGTKKHQKQKGKNHGSQ